MIINFFKFLTVGHAKKVELLHCAKFRLNRSNRGRGIAICRFFKTAAAAILDLKNSKFLKVGTVKRVKLRHRAKFRQNRSNHGRDIVIFRFFKMAAAAILDFRNFKFLTSRECPCDVIVTSHVHNDISFLDFSGSISYMSIIHL